MRFVQLASMQWSELHRLFGVGFAAATLAVGSCVPAEPTTTPVSVTPSTPGVDSLVRPNIIFLLADDMRYDALGATGNTIVRTPHLDGLARQGVSFRNSYVTTPICDISRASIFSGQYARRHGLVDFSADFTPAALAETYPALLHGAGYRTGFIGKYGVGDHPPAKAFDYWRGFAGQGTYETNDSTGKPIHLTQLMSDQAVLFLESQPRNRPFVLSVSFKAPHVQDEDPRQFIPDPVDANMYSGILIPPPVTADDTYWTALPQFFRVNNEGRERWKTLFSTAPKYQASVKGYYQLISGLDRAVGDIRAALTRLGMDRNTVIIFTSDNGFFLGEHGLAHKWYGFEESVRVPLVVYDPRYLTGQGGRTEASIALNIDLAPTMLQLAGVPVPESMQGKSLLPLVRGEKPSWREDFLFEHLYVNPMIRESAGVVGGRYKYLRYLDPNPNYEQLFDLAIDPNETTNYALDPRYQAVLAQLRQRYAELVAQAR